MAKEDDALLSMENALAREIEEKKKQLEKLQVEITEGLAHLQSLQKLRQWRQGKPLSAYPQPSTPPASTESDIHQRGWMKEQLVYWIKAVAPQRFRGRDAAQWFKQKLAQQGEELKPYQYNNVFMLLKEMAAKEDLVKRVNSHYEKIDLSTRLTLVSDGAREERK